MRALGRCRGRSFHVPLTRWIDWDTDARQRWIDSTGSFFGIGRPDDMVAPPTRRRRGSCEVPSRRSSGTGVPSPSRTAASAYALSTAQAYASIGSGDSTESRSSSVDVSPDDVFEGVAHLRSCRRPRWTGQGEAAAQSYLDFVLTSSAKHLWPLQVLWTALQRSSRPSRCSASDRAVRVECCSGRGKSWRQRSSGEPVLPGVLGVGCFVTG